MASGHAAAARSDDAYTASKSSFTFAGGPTSARNRGAPVSPYFCLRNAPKIDFWRGDKKGFFRRTSRRQAVFSSASASSSIIVLRIRNFCAFPLTVIGNESTKRT